MLADVCEKIHPYSSEDNVLITASSTQIPPSAIPVWCTGTYDVSRDVNDGDPTEAREWIDIAVVLVVICIRKTKKKNIKKS